MEQATEQPEWARGYPIAELKAKAAPFKSLHRPLAFGAYGSVREADVAAALDRGGYFSVGMEHDAAAIVRGMPNAVTVFKDFRGEEIALSGKAYVQAFAARALNPGIDLMRSLIETLGKDIVLELFEEDQIAKQVAAGFGFTWQGSKIGAASEIKGVYKIGGASMALEAEEQATLEVLMHGFLAPAERMLIEAEIAKASQHWEQHYSSYNKRQSWTAFALRGFSDDPAFIIKPAEMSRGWKALNPDKLRAEAKQTRIAAVFPDTIGLIERSFGPLSGFERIRFMRLAPDGGELTRHADITDRDAGVQDGKIARLHIPIRTSPLVTFFGWNERGHQIERHLPAGALCYLDQRKPHRVRNGDPTVDRVHLVLDMRCNDVLRQRIKATMEGR